MPITVFAAIKGNLQSLLGGAEVSLLQGPPVAEVAEKGGTVYERLMTIDEVPYLFAARRPRVPFTRTEETFCRELLAAFEALYSGFHREGYAGHFRTALLSSLTDITVARFLRGDHQKAFWSIQELIQLLKNLSYQRYEGEPATTGFLIYRTTPHDFRKRARSRKHTLIELQPQQSLTADFFDNPLTYRFIDGAGSLFVGNIQMQVTGIIRAAPSGDGDTVDRATHQDTFSLLSIAGTGAFAVKVNRTSEIEVIISPDKLLVRRKGQWGIFDPDIFRAFLGENIDGEAIDDLVRTVYALSKTRHGTVVLICEQASAKLKKLKKGSVGGDDPLSQILIRHVKGKSISQLRRSGELIRVLSSDGMTMFSRRGKLLDTGVIIDTSLARGLVTGGGRTTAATAASWYGKVIKVSEDGPIELYQEGQLVYRFG